MAGGWTRDGAVQDQIDDTVKDVIQWAGARMPSGVAETHCEECPKNGAWRCRRQDLHSCQSGRDTSAAFSAFNRRGSKDSQLS